MTELLAANTYWGLLLTVGVFVLCRSLQAKWRSAALNPILLASGFIILILSVCKIPVDAYTAGCAPLQYLLTPATICYAVGLYEQIGKLKKHLAAILAGVLSGTVVSLLGIRLLCSVFHLDAALTASLLPKSITTAIGMALSQEAGGIASLTTAAIVLTGVLGNVFGPALCRWFRFRSEIAQGVAFGTASHAIGTSKAAEMSELAGAVSSLSLTFAGLITVLLYSFLI